MTVGTTLLTPPLQHAEWHYSGTVCQSALLAFRNTRRLCSCTCFKMFFSRYLNTATQKYTCKHKEKYKHKFLNKPSYHTIQCKCACVCVCSVYVGGTYIRTYVCVPVCTCTVTAVLGIKGLGCWQLQVTLGYVEHAYEMLHITIHRNDLISMTQVKGYWPVRHAFAYVANTNFN